MTTATSTPDNFDQAVTRTASDMAQQVRMENEQTRSMNSNSVSFTRTQVSVNDIRLDGNTHTRSAVKQLVVDQYAEAMSRSETFPAVTLYFDGEYWLADGFHIVSAAKQCGLDSVLADVKNGGRREARFHAAGANSNHGLQRTNADKRRSVFTLLYDMEWRLWADRDIARHCGVDNAFVSKLRQEMIAAETTAVDRQQNNAAPLGVEGYPGAIVSCPIELPLPTRQLVKYSLLADNQDEVRELSLRSFQRQKQILEVIEKGLRATVAEADRYLRGLKGEARYKQRMDSVGDFTSENYVLGDCLVHLKALPPKSVRLLLCDPPYGMGLKLRGNDSAPIVGDKDITTALCLLRDMLAAIDHAMADESHALVFSHWRYEYHFRGVLENAGYDVRNVLIWAKNKNGSGYTGDFAPNHECIVHAVRGGATIAPREPTVLHVPIENSTEHICEKPTLLLSRLIKCTTEPGELVVDPFAGTASTLVAAAQTGRRYFGTELVEDYHREGLSRLKALQTTTSSASTYQAPKTTLDLDTGTTPLALAA